MQYDVAIVGGGINGAGILLDLTIRGLRCVLFEKVDFGWATTSASSRLIHGGARYILNDIGVTYKSSKEAGILTKIAPHLLSRKPFLIPSSNSIMIEAFDAYMSLYNIFSRLRGAKRKKRVSNEYVKSLTLGCVKSKYGGILLEEYSTNPARLTFSCIMSAFERGAKIFNHKEVLSVRKENGFFHIISLDKLTGQKEHYKSKAIVNVSGPWSDITAERAGLTVRIRPTKGIHILFSGKPFDTILSFPSIDGRYLLLVPLEGYTILGTTDDDFFGDRDSPDITFDDVEYLIRSAETVFPSIRKLKAYSTTVGLRPTVFKYGVLEDKITREYEVFNNDGFISVIGGKLASFRLLSEIVSDEVVRTLGVKKKSDTKNTKLYGAEDYSAEYYPDYELYSKSISEKVAERFKIPKEISDSLVRKYGCRVYDVLSSGNHSVLCQCRGVLECEIRWSIKNEFAKTPDDIMRRTGAGDGVCQGIMCICKIAQILQGYLNLDDKKTKELITQFLKRKLKLAEPIKHISPDVYFTLLEYMKSSDIL